MKISIRSFTSRLLLALALTCFGANAPAQQLSDDGNPAESATTTALATKFVKLVDQGKSAEAWASAGPILRGVTDAAGWAKTLKAMRPAPLKKRVLSAAKFTKVIDGAPSGHYFVVFFVTTLGKGTYEEKVIYSRMKGKWVVEGYYLTPIQE